MGHKLLISVFHKNNCICYCSYNNNKTIDWENTIHMIVSIIERWCSNPCVTCTPTTWSQMIGQSANHQDAGYHLLLLLPLAVSHSDFATCCKEKESLTYKSAFLNNRSQYIVSDLKSSAGSRLFNICMRHHRKY